MTPIVFINQLSKASEALWLQALRQVMPLETFLLPEELSLEQMDEVNIAIVADPNPDVVATFPNLVWVQSLWAGVERLVDQFTNSDFKIVRLIDPNLSKTMAEAVLAWVLYLQRNMPDYAKLQSQNSWQPLPYKAAAETRIGILGAGALGMESLNVLKRFEYPLNAWSRTLKSIDGVNCYSGKEGLTELVTNSDILISLLPLTPETKQILNYDLMSNLPVGGKVINFSRGAVVDTNALLKLLEEGHVAHAVLDVFEQEPLPPSNSLWQHPNITVLPHISAPTSDKSAADIVKNNIASYRKNGVIPEYVDIKKGY